jgi:hypothetical protein
MTLHSGLIPAVIGIMNSRLSSIASVGGGRTHALDVAFIAYVACCAGKRWL